MEPLDISDLTEQQAKFVSVLAFNSTLLDNLIKCSKFWGNSHWCTDCTAETGCDDCYSGDTHHEMEFETETIMSQLWDEVKNYDDRYVTDDSSNAVDDDDSSSSSA